MQIKRSLVAIIASLAVAAVPAIASAQVSVGVGVGFGGPGWAVGVVAGYPPPALPVYSMPPAPYPNWQWIPGYWGCGGSGYYWVPGYWTAPPDVGYYWTPGYWNYVNGAYAWNAGYWGPTVGFYGGINYGFGYFGTGFVGGFWSGGVFNYNTAVVNVNRTVIHNTFVNRGVVHGGVVGRSRASFNGGRRGIHATPTRAQLAARRHAVAETAAQRTHERAAARERGQLASVNHGRPRVVAVQKPLETSRATKHTTHGTVGAAAHHNASVARHGTVSATAHHNASVARHGTVSATAHHSASVARHGTVSATAHHGQLSSGAIHGVHLQQGSSYRHVGMNSGRVGGGGAVHAARPSGGGFSHGGTSGGRPAGGGSPRGGMSGGRPGGGGGRPPKGRS
jgi:hypothetical protein